MCLGTSNPSSETMFMGGGTGNWNDRVLLLAEMGLAAFKSAKTLASLELTWTM